MRLLLIAAVCLGHPAFGEWQRYAQGGAGRDWPGVADPHPLSYFTEEAKVRDDSGRVGCAYCTPADKAQFIKESRAEVVEDGQIGDYSVYDLYYYSVCDSPVYCKADVLRAKSILVRTGPDEFREIFYTSLNGGAGTTRIIGEKLPNQLLWVWQPDGAMGMYNEYMFWLDETGSMQPDLKAVGIAESTLMKTALLKASQANYRDATYESNASDLIWHVPIRDLETHFENGKEWIDRVTEIGTIEVTFRIEHGRAIVTGQSYQARPSGTQR